MTFLAPFFVSLTHNQSDPVIAQIHKRIQPKDRLKYVWDKAKGRTTCEPDEVPKEDEDQPVEPILGHGGCGHVQPVIRKEGLKLFVVYKKGKEEEEVTIRSFVDFVVPFGVWRPNRRHASIGRCQSAVNPDDGLVARQELILLVHRPFSCSLPRPSLLSHLLQDSKISQPDKRPFSAYEAHNLLRKVSSSDLDIMGLSEDYARPDWMILTVLPVPPPPVRPSISIDGGAMRSEDDLTYKLAEILKASIQVRTKEQEGVPPSVLEPFEQLLQVRTLIPAV